MGSPAGQTPEAEGERLKNQRGQPPGEADSISGDISVEALAGRNKASPLLSNPEPDSSTNRYKWFQSFPASACPWASFTSYCIGWRCSLECRANAARKLYRRIVRTLEALPPEATVNKLDLAGGGLLPPDAHRRARQRFMRALRGWNKGRQEPARLLFVTEAAPQSGKLHAHGLIYGITLPTLDDLAGWWRSAVGGDGTIVYEPAESVGAVARYATKHEMGSAPARLLRKGTKTNRAIPVVWGNTKGAGSFWARPTDKRLIMTATYSDMTEEDHESSQAIEVEDLKAVELGSLPTLPSGNPEEKIPKHQEAIMITPFSNGGTSFEAALSMELCAERLRATVLTYIHGQGEDGATDQEIQEALAMTSDTQVPRRWELVRSGLVHDSGVKRRNKSGRRAIVWTVVKGSDSEPCGGRS